MGAGFQEIEDDVVIFLGIFNLRYVPTILHHNQLCFACT